MPRRFDKISTKLWRDDGLGSAELLRGSFAGFAYDIHTHDKACFALLTRGAIRIRMRGHEFVARAGDLYAIDPEEPHAGWPIDDEGWSLRTLYVRPQELHALYSCGEGVLSHTPSIAGPIIRDEVLAAHFVEVHRSSEVAAAPLQREQAYLDFISDLFARHMRNVASPDATASREDRAIRIARDFLDEHLDQRVRLDEVARAAGLPALKLFRSFERATGMSPHGYQRQARMRLATELIRRGRALSVVAATTGFADQAHMTRSFRRTLGVTPGAYRQAFTAAPRIAADGR